ncbi:hypothetical protein Scep_027727 [Stephania cephalantha]|uniref:Uncharacterized protein n=1 Tax=Stephania cephalantha TaxID=152367 RepID=A0AAP0E8G9_9MAGN
MKNSSNGLNKGPNYIIKRSLSCKRDDYKNDEYLIGEEDLICHQKDTLNDETMMNVEDNEHVMEEHFDIDWLTPCAYEY